LPPASVPIRPQTATRALPDDGALAELIAAWPTLPEAIRAGILAMVRASGNRVAEQADRDPL
jgi:hypothetical protein